MPPQLSLIREIFADLSSSKALSGMSMGLVSGLVTLIMQISFAVMIFAGPLQEHAQRAMGLTLAGTTLLLFVTALFGGFKSSINFSQDAPTAIFAGAAAGMASSLIACDANTVFITLTAGLMVSTLTTGLLFILAARLRFAELLRFMPYPVVAGFLAGTGWLLSAGSLEVMTGLSLSRNTLPLLFQPSLLLLWIPGTAFALALFLIMQRWKHFFLMPGALLLALLICHALLPLFGISMEEARNLGIFFAPFSTTSIWPAFSLSDLSSIQWTAILNEAPTLAIIPFIALIGLLLNTSGIEMASQRDLDTNRELMVNGSGNLLAALVGAPAGYTSISLSLLGFKTGAETRLVGLSAGLLMICVLLFGGQILSFFPKGLLGGFLMLLGISFLSEFILDTRKRMPTADYVIVLLVFAAIGLFGYLQGVLFGLFATTGLFVLRFSRIPALAGTGNGAAVHSTRQRPLPHQRLLMEHGDCIQFFTLTGYLFFGSVSTLSRNIMDASDDRPTRFILVDFSRISGFDISSVNNFVRLTHKLRQREITVLLAGVPPLFEKLLYPSVGNDLEIPLLTFENRNAALEWSEDQLLEILQREKGQSHLQKREIKDALFDSVSESLLRRLACQEKVESLMENLHPLLEIKRLETREMLVRAGQKMDAMVFVREGLIREYLATEGGKHAKLRAFGPGTFFAEPAAYAPWLTPHAYVAETRTEVALFRPEAFRKLEETNPQKALEIHRLLMEALSQGQTMSPE